VAKVGCFLFTFPFPSRTDFARLHRPKIALAHLIRGSFVAAYINEAQSRSSSSSFPLLPDACPYFSAPRRRSSSAVSLRSRSVTGGKKALGGYCRGGQGGDVPVYFRAKSQGPVDRYVSLFPPPLLSSLAASHI
jgi:hypothetical protein